MYAVIKHNNSDTSGKPTVARHSFRNDSARYMELLLLPTLFSSILAEPLNILAFVRKVNWHENSNSRSQSDNCAIQIHVVLQSCRLIRWSITSHADIPKTKDCRLSIVDVLKSLVQWDHKMIEELVAGGTGIDIERKSNCERGTTRLFYRYLQNLHDKSTQQTRYDSYAPPLIYRARIVR